MQQTNTYYLPQEILLSIFSYCNNQKKLSYLDVGTGYFLKTNQHIGPDPRMLAILALVCKEWHRISLDNSLWKAFAVIQEIPINFDTGVSSVAALFKLRIQTFVSAFRNFPNYSHFEDRVIYKKNIQNPSMGIEEEYDCALSKPPLFESLRRYRALFPDSKALSSPAVASLVARKDFHGVLDKELAVKKFLANASEIFLFLSEEDALGESWCIEEEGRTRKVLHILSKSPHGDVIIKTLDLTDFHSEEDFCNYLLTYSMRSQSLKEQCNFSLESDIGAAVESKEFHGVLFRHEAEEILKHAQGIGGYLFYVERDSLTLYLGANWNGKISHRPIDRLLWALSPNNPGKLKESLEHRVAPILAETRATEEAFNKHAELAQSPLAPALLIRKDFHGELSRSETEKKLVVSGQANSYLIRVSENSKNRVIASIRFLGQNGTYQFKHMLLHKDFLLQNAERGDFQDMLDKKFLAFCNMQPITSEIDYHAGVIYQPHKQMHYFFGLANQLILY